MAAAGPRSVLEFYGTSIYKADLELLEPGQWLNDSLITFAMDYCANKLAAGRKDWAFVHPGTCLLARLDPDIEDVHSMLSGLGLASCSMVCFPVNNNPDFRVAGGGTHWSLLVFRRTDTGGRFVHFDSHAGSNRAVAAQLAAKLHGMLTAEDTPSAEGAAGVVEAATPQQSNTSDCGVFTALIAEALASGKSEDDIGALESDAATAHRRELGQRIEALAAASV